ncbi:MAG: carboxypeptidase-like regulatory domain-containing protein, partial [Bacteroidota bacterium]
MRVLIFALLTGLLPLWTNAQFMVSGTVTDKNSGQALAGIEVMVVENGRKSLTDSKGNFRLENLRGRITLMLTGEKYQSSTKT